MADRICYPPNWTQKDRDDLDALFERARKERLMFFIQSMATGPMWFTPNELQQQQEKGSFIWGAVNWQLCDPEKYRKLLLERMASAAEEYVESKQRLSTGWD